MKNAELQLDVSMPDCGVPLRIGESPLDRFLLNGERPGDITRLYMFSWEPPPPALPAAPPALATFSFAWVARISDEIQTGSQKLTVSVV